MAKTTGTLEKLARELALALAPLRELDLQTMQAVSLDLDITIPPATLASPSFASAITTTASAGAQLPPIIDQLTAAIDADDTNGILATGLELIAASGAVIGSLAAIDMQLPGTAFSGHLISYLIIRYLEFAWPTVSNILTLLGVIDRIHDSGIVGDPNHPPRVIRVLHLDRFGTLLHDPLMVAHDVYQWGDPGFTGQLLLQRLRDAFSDIPYPAALSTEAGVAQVLTSPFFDVAPDTTSRPHALRVVIHVPLSGSLDQVIPLPNPAWTIHLTTNVSLAGGTEIVMTPPANITVGSPSGTLAGEIVASFVGTPVPPNDALVLIGETGGSRLQAHHLAAAIGFAFTAADTGATVDPVIRLDAGAGKLIIDTSHSDGFISKLLSGAQVQADFDLAASWRPSTGLRFHGSAGIELETALSISLGPVDINRLHIGIGIDTTGGITFELSLGLNAVLGPLQASVERIGATGLLTFPATGGNLGRADFTIGFKPPTGLGIAINAGPVTGSGFIEFDPDNGRYAGVVGWFEDDDSGDAAALESWIGARLDEGVRVALFHHLGFTPKGAFLRRLGMGRTTGRLRPPPRIERHGPSVGQGSDGEHRLTPRPGVTDVDTAHPGQPAGRRDMPLRWPPTRSGAASQLTSAFLALRAPCRARRARPRD